MRSTTSAIAFVRGVGLPDATNALWRVRPDGGDVHQLFTTPTSDDAGTGLVWAPDGESLLFESDHGDSSTIIHLVPLEPLTVTPLTSADSSASDPSWSPDGTHIAYSVFATDPFDEDNAPKGLRIINADGSGLIELTHPSKGFDSHPVWPPLPAIAS